MNSGRIDKKLLERFRRLILEKLRTKNRRIYTACLAARDGGLLPDNYDSLPYAKKRDVMREAKRQASRMLNRMEVCGDLRSFPIDGRSETFYALPKRIDRNPYDLSPAATLGHVAEGHWASRNRAELVTDAYLDLLAKGNEELEGNPKLAKEIGKGRAQRRVYKLKRSGKIIIAFAHVATWGGGLRDKFRLSIKGRAHDYCSNAILSPYIREGNIKMLYISWPDQRTTKLQTWLEEVFSEFSLPRKLVCIEPWVPIPRENYDD